MMQCSLQLQNASCRYSTTLKEGCENNESLNKTKALIFERDEERTKCKISVNGRDGRYEMDVERCIAAGNRVNEALAAQ